MRKILYLFVSCFFITALSAQTPACVPNQLFKDSSAGVYPLPLSTANPRGGIDKPVCIGKPYEFVFTMKISDTLVTPLGTVKIDSVKLATTGAVVGLPAGITYACNPPNCTFAKKTTGCAVLRGTTTGPVGDYDLVINGKAYVDIFGAIDVSFPGIVAAGKYTLKVVAANNAVCTTASLFSPDEIASLSSTPNPASLSTTINIESQQTGVYNFAVYNIVGQSVFSTPLSIQVGSNSLNLSTEDFPSGMYIYKLTKDNKQISNKLIVNH
jgi:Secretion system C-terminal sorting domain